MSELVREVQENQRILCPDIGNSRGKRDHIITNYILNIIYNNNAKDEDGEFISEDVRKIYEQITGAQSDYMYLHRSITYLHRSKQTVTTFYWKCHTCGTIVPATGVSNDFDSRGL